MPQTSKGKVGESSSKTRGQKMIATANSLPKQQHVDNFFRLGQKK